MSPVRRSRGAARMTGVTALAVLGVLLALAVSGCTGEASSSSTAPPTTRAADPGTPLEDLDTTALVVRRAPFCDLVDPEAVTRALGEEVSGVTVYRSGQRVKVSDDLADVVHEFGCRWSAGDSTAEAWVFAPPVTRGRAKVLLRGGCDGTGPAYGDPSATCRTQADGRVTVTTRGLFGDAWLTCRLTVDAGTADLEDRAGRWCAAVAEGAATAS